MSTYTTKVRRIGRESATLRPESPTIYRLDFDLIDNAHIRTTLQSWGWCLLDEMVDILNSRPGSARCFNPSDVIRGFAAVNAHTADNNPYAIYISITDLGIVTRATDRFRHLDILSGDVYIPAKWAAKIVSLQRKIPNIRMTKWVPGMRGARIYRLIAIDSNNSEHTMNSKFSPLLTHFERLYD